MDEDNHDGVPGCSQKAPDMRRGKGKAREEQVEEDNSGPSMMSRVRDSARMAGSAFIDSRAALPGMSTTLEGKGMQTNASASSTSTPHQGQYQGVQSDAAARPVRKTETGETFRQSQRELHHSSKAFDDFVEARQPLPELGEAQLGMQNLVSVPLGRQSSSTAVAEAEAADGSAIADILSQPDDPSTLPTMEEQPEAISAEDAAKLRAALFDGPSSGGLPWDHLLNFTPEFASLQSISGDLQNERQSHIGVADPERATDIWLRQWHDVLASYTDEVWGDLGTLVEQAKREVQKDMSGSSDGRAEPPALSRLKMILAHIRGAG